jgi:hypothetical protein
MRNLIMLLIYEDTGKEVKKGDIVTLRDGTTATVNSFPKPHKPASSGLVYITTETETDTSYYVSVIGAEWIGCEDRANYE